MEEQGNDRNYLATPAGLFDACRAGVVEAIDRILAARPEFLVIDNPYCWTKTAEGHEIRGSYNKKPIEVAAFFNQSRAVAKLLEISRDGHAIRKPWDPHLPFDGHFNALSIARALGHADVVSVVESEVWTRLDRYPELLDEATDSGRTVLYYAAVQGHMPLVRGLLSRGANPDPIQASGHRAIHAVLDPPIDDAVESESDRAERRAVAQRLIEQGAADDLWISCALGDISRVTEWLVRDPSLANHNFRPDRRGFSLGFPLVPASRNGYVEIVELLLDHGADVNCVLGEEDPHESGYALMAAIYGNHFDLVELLLDRGASWKAHAYCAPSFVDELYRAALQASSSLTSHRQLADLEDHADRPVAVNLYQRVLRLGAEPSDDALVLMRDHREVERLLQDSPETPTSLGENRVDSLSSAAAWQGDLKSIELCLSLRPQYQTVASANHCIESAIKSHNRFGSFSDYRRIIETNLQFLREREADVTCHPLWLLADDFLENYRYGDTPDMPTIEHLLNLADLFLDYGVDIDQRHGESGRTALTHAVNEGHLEYVELLLRRGATIHRDDPPESNPILLARKHGFADILMRLGEQAQPWGETTSSDTIPIDLPVADGPAGLMAPLRNTILRLGIASIKHEFRPMGERGDSCGQFIEFPEPFAREQFDQVRVIITNRNHPQILGSATTGLLRGVQGFWLTARNSRPVNGVEDGEPTIQEVSFSWLAVLPTNQPQDQEWDVRFGLVPWREYEAYSCHKYVEAEELYAEQPMKATRYPKFVFLTTTESNVINAAASVADDRGIRDLVGYQLSRHDGGGRLYWMVIGERDARPSSGRARDGYFDANSLWIHASRVEPVDFIETGIPGAWRRSWVKYPRRFEERRPCVFVTSNGHGVRGHHASVMAMIWNGTSSDFPITGLSIDPIRGQSNFDTITIGHAEDAADRQLLTHVKPSQMDPWDFLAGTDDDETSYELAASGRIGVNEIGPRGATLLMHAIYERHERVNTALARRLFALGADPNQAHPVTRCTPLHLAAFLNRIDMTWLLLERDAKVNVSTIAGTDSPFPTPHDCYRIGREPLRRHRGETPLHLAMLHRHFKIARILLNAGADPNAEDAHGDRPLDYVPNWYATPDDPLHWRLVNHRSTATREDYERIIQRFLESP